MTGATEPIALKWSRSGKNIRYGYSNIIAKAESVEYAALIVRSVNAAPGLAKALRRVQEIYGKRQPPPVDSEQPDDIWGEAREALKLWEQ